MYGESMGIAVWIAFGLACMVLLSTVLVHFWVITLIVIGGVTAIIGVALWITNLIITLRALRTARREYPGQF
jgi:hypothetical protein